MYHFNLVGFFSRATGIDFYSQKQRWKLFLLVFAALIVLASLYYTDTMVRKIAADEQQRVALWADAIRKRETLLQDSERLFRAIQEEERKRVELITNVYNRLNHADLNSQTLTFYTNILQSNTTIPLIETDEDGRIIRSSNLHERFDHFEVLEGALADYFAAYAPLSYPIIGGHRYIYYRDSRVYTDLRNVMDDLIDTYISELVINAANVPVVVVDSTMTRLIAHGNIEGVDFEDNDQVMELIGSMAGRNNSLSVNLPDYGRCYVYYTNSFLLTQIRYYPIAQFLAVGVFLILSYLLFSIARRSEQNKVWVGMSKETAHQLGTPLSSLMGWVELLKMKGVDGETIAEISKDIERLESITERFSKIGSAPRLEAVFLQDVLQEVIAYMEKRISSKVHIHAALPEEPVLLPLNPHLFSWVVENLIKNAVDATKGSGNIFLSIDNQKRQVAVDIGDDGRGIPVSRQKAVFNPGYTSKKSGWGLGLSLSRRIVEEYHKGQLFVKHSVVNEGTTFRIVLPKHNNL